jgi:hypothetical protein
MPTGITERPLYDRIALETSAWTTPFSWVNRTNNIVGSVAYSQGGRVGTPGQSQVDVGTLNATFKDLDSPPAVGDLVRLRRAGTTEYAFVGYVQDVAQEVVFDRTVSFSTPVVLTSINCLDWVGYISQFQAIGIGGLSATFTEQDNYGFDSRVRALNNLIDATNATQMISAPSSLVLTVGDTDMVGTFSDHLDLVAATQNLYWYGLNVLPTNKTTGRTGLVQIRTLASAPSSGKTFTDQVGTAGQLHYVELSQESSSQNVANTIVLNNYSIITATSPTAPSFIPQLITSIGGATRPNFAIVGGKELVSVPYEATWTQSDATSVTTYGNRATEITTNLAGLVEDYNLVGNPSVEYDDTGWSTGANRMARRKPKDNGVPFDAYTGEWAVRYRLATGGASTPSFRYSGSENDGIPIIAGDPYMFQAAGARGANTFSNTRVRAYIEWQNNAGNVISTSNGTRITCTNAYQWYVPTVQATAPANAERAIVGLEFDRTSGSFSVGDQMWLDGAMLRSSASATAVAYFDGDTPSTTSSIYLWTGSVGQSQSFKVTNNLDDTIATYLARYATTSNRVTRIRWNAQEDLSATASMHVGSTISVIFDGVTTTHRIVGIDGTIEAERYMIDYYLEKV